MGNMRSKNRGSNPLRRRDKRKKRAVARSILLVTNGRVTERDYLQKAINAFQFSEGIKCRVKFIAGAPQTLFKDVQAMDTSEIEEIWLFFDRDDNNLNLLKSLLSKSEHSGYKSIVSNPCFEVWLHAHYGLVNLCSRQSDAIKRYEKISGIPSDSKDIPDDFPFENWKTAMDNLDRSESAILKHTSGKYGNSDVNEIIDSPSTSMGKFLEHLDFLKTQI